ncbi:photosystem II reaction center protein PsbN [Spirulina sp. CS-785/01]|nr:photosystem II reaction center protein PsbN [Spirulina sp. CS-785/01]MDB9312384.1 photosystem II reaction center protein PsbN [Spirulina sp. CS-785/01]
MDSTTVFIISIGALVLGVTGYAVYYAFGAPSAELNDPFEDHED